MLRSTCCRPLFTLFYVPCITEAWTSVILEGGPKVINKMSLAKIFGGGKKKETAPSTQDAIMKLRGTEELLQKKSTHLESKIAAEIAAAKKAGTKNKRGERTL